MDPLSVTASIIAVIQISGSVVSICYSYRNAVKGAAEEAAKITDEVKSLQDVLDRLLKIAEREVARGSTRLQALQALQALAEPNGALSQCQAELSALQIKLEPAQKVKMTWKALKWPLTEVSVNKAIDNISRLKATLTLAIVADQMSISLAIEESVATVAATQRSFIFDKTKLDIHAWLRAPDPSSNHVAARRKAHAGTGSWLVQNAEYTAWKSNAATFLWLNGIPGCGKTILCSTIIEDVINYCQSKPTSIVTYFYFDFNDTEKQDYEKVLRSITAQILAQCPQIPNPLLRLYVDSFSGYEQPKNAALLTSVRCIFEQLGESYIILDALDESEDREELLQWIQRVSNWRLPNVHILVTSRKENDIDDTLSSLLTGQICMQSTLIDADIVAFVRDKLVQDPKLKKWPDKVRAEIEATLIEGACGMFRWVVCQIDSLRKCIKLPSLQTALRSLPRTLDETYTRILENIDEEYSQDALRVLQWLTYSPRPVQPEEAVEILAIDWETEGIPNFDLSFRLSDPTDLLIICSSLITIEESPSNRRDNATQEKTKVLKLAHSSVKDYLMSDRIRSSRAAFYAVEEPISQAFISKCCLVYLLQFTTPVKEETAQAFPLTRYAAQYWPHHLLAAGNTQSQNLEDLAFALLMSDQVPYASWCRFYDPDMPWLDEVRSGWTDNSPLYYTSILGLDRLSERLIKAKVDPNVSGGLFESPLLAAVRRGHEEIVRTLLRAGAIVDPGHTYSLPPLKVAAACGHEVIVKELLEKGAYIDHFDLLGGTALSSAARNGHGTVVRILLDAGADPEKWSRKAEIGIPLVEAASNGFEDVVRQLLPSAKSFAIKHALVAAADKGHENTVRSIITNGIDPDLALSCASRVGIQDLVSRLIDEGALVNQNPELANRILASRKMPGYMSPLTAAAASGHAVILQQLIAKGAELETSALLLATENGHGQVTELLLQEKAYDMETISEALISAVEGGHILVTKLLLDHGADIESHDHWHVRPLHTAAHNGNIEMLKLLLDRGADINSAGGDRGSVIQGSAIQDAAYRGDMRMVQYLIERGAEIDMYGLGLPNALQNAVSKGHITLIKFLLSAGAELESDGGHGTALQSAIPGDRPDIVLLLLEHGANLNLVGEARDRKTESLPSPLLHATMEGHVKIVKLLLEHGADVNAPSWFGGSSSLPLHTAAGKGDIEILQMLLKHGANVDAQTEDGGSAIHSAARNGQHEALSILLFEYHANPSLSWMNGSLALHTTASHGYTKCVELCLKAGMDVNARNNSGRTALHWAAKNGYHSTVQLLLDRGVDPGVKEIGTNMTALDIAKQKAWEQPENKSRQDLVRILTGKEAGLMALRSD